MAKATGTFSESWYRIAGLRVWLRPHAEVQRQTFRAKRWHILRDPLSNRFFRLHPAAYEFVARLRRDRTVEEVWHECLDRFPDDAPGQQDVLQLLGQLFAANLLHTSAPADSAAIFKRFAKRRGQEIRGTLTNIMFARIPLWDPDRFLRGALPALGWLFGPLGAGLWLTVMAVAGKSMVEHWPELLRESQGVLAPSNLPLLYAGLVTLKILHELGHAFICRRHGGEVHVLGVMFLLFTPLPYVDASSAWSFRSRWRRLLVGAAGIVVEVFVAGLAALVWARTGPGVLHALAYNMMFVASLSTVLFNANPLLRFDGYYILSDLLDIPNLHGQAALQLRHVVERYAFGCRDSHSPTASHREAAWLVVFGVCSRIYRVIVFGGILLFVGSKFLLAGIVMGAVCFFSWLVLPTVRFIRYLASDPRLDRTRLRAVGVSMAVLAVLVVGVGVVPVRARLRAPGVITAEPTSLVLSHTEGRLVEVVAIPGGRVSAGEVLARLENPDLVDEQRLLRVQKGQAELFRRQALVNGAGDVGAIEAHAEALRLRLIRVSEKIDGLELRAPLAGQWASHGTERRIGQWLRRGTALGRVTGEAAAVFRGVVTQADASRLFGEPPRADSSASRREPTLRRAAASRGGPPSRPGRGGPAGSRRRHPAR